VVKTRRRREILRDRTDFRRHQVNDQPLGDHQHVAGAGAETVEQPAARIGVGQIESDALDLAHRRRIAEDLFLVVEDVGEIDFHPSESRRQLHAIGPRIESRREVDHQIGALLDLLRTNRSNR